MFTLLFFHAWKLLYAHLSPRNHCITLHLATNKMVTPDSERKNCVSSHLRKGKETIRRERISGLNPPNTPALCSISEKTGSSQRMKKI